MNRKRIGNFKIGEEVLITTYNPPMKAKIADMYELPFQQVPIDDISLIRKYNGKNVPIIEVFIEGKVRSFISEVVKKV
jgi:hypothetical protein